MLELGVIRLEQNLESLMTVKAVFKRSSADLLAAYPEVIPIDLPAFTPSFDPLHPEWTARFASGDASFGLNFSKSNGSKLDYSCRPQFRIWQDQRDLFLLKRITR